jgi:iduronate 2-sulfatase
MPAEVLTLKRRCHESPHKERVEMSSMQLLTRRDFLRSSLAGTAYLAAGGLAFARESGDEANQLNVLFFAVDDLRPQLGCYGWPKVHTPNIDALAARGTVFNRAYCQQAVCSPSRTSLLTGLRPDSTRIYDLHTHFRFYLPDVVTLPQHFMRHGYHTQSFGKIYHGGLDDPESWSVPSWRAGGSGYGKPETLAMLQEQREQLLSEGKDLSTKVVEKDPQTGLALKLARPRDRVRGPAWEDPDVPDNALPDGNTADEAIKTLREIKDRPFFLAVGFLKPHLPFVAPKKYYDLYSSESIALADNPFPPKDCPEIALTNWGELRNYQGIPKSGPLPDEMARQLIRGYFACASYTDAQIGRLLDEINRLGLTDRTVVVLWGDHGWQLGEHGLWCKHTNFEVATRSPLIFSAPNQSHQGARTEALAEFVDIYPTLCELCDLPIPERLEGISVVPVMEDPDRPWKKAAFSQYPRGQVMGYSMRTDRYRYTEWRGPEGEQVAIELYDHHEDPAENVNLASLSECESKVAELHKMLEDGWRAVLPAKSGTQGGERK